MMNSDIDETAPTTTAEDAVTTDAAQILQDEKLMTTAATVGVVAVGAALFEVALLPGIALGVAAMIAPKYVSKIGSAVTPMFRSSVRGIYKFGQKTNEMVAEAKEQMQDIVAEVKAESDVKVDEPKGKPAPTGPTAVAA
jgi:hypothetical protein